MGRFAPDVPRQPIASDILVAWDIRRSMSRRPHWPHVPALSMVSLAPAVKPVLSGLQRLGCKKEAPRSGLTLASLAEHPSVEQAPRLPPDVIHRHKPVARSPNVSPVEQSEQIEGGTFGFAMDYLVDHALNLTELDAKFNHDGLGEPRTCPVDAVCRPIPACEARYKRLLLITKRKCGTLAGEMLNLDSCFAAPGPHAMGAREWVSCTTSLRGPSRSAQLQLSP